jgi:hypothetical protein
MLSQSALTLRARLILQQSPSETADCHGRQKIHIAKSQKDSLTQSGRPEQSSCNVVVQVTTHVSLPHISLTTLNENFVVF